MGSNFLVSKMSSSSIPATSSPAEEDMPEVKLEERCLENKQSTATSSSSVSEGCGSVILKSRGMPSPTHRRTSGPIRRAKGGWTPKEDETLRSAVTTFRGKSWKKIAEFFPDRSEVQCLHRWQKVLNPNLVKGPWTQKEDEKIIELVAEHGPTKWSLIAKSLPGRIGKQCRERWHNHLNPEIKKDPWTQEEELVLMDAHRTYGNKWAEIARVLPGRTDNAIKNHWNSSLKKKFDFYLATGKLPPIAKSSPQNGPNDSSRCSATKSLLDYSNEEMASRVQTLSGNVGSYKMHEDGKEHLESSALLLDVGASSSVHPNDSTDSEGVECKTQSSGINPTYSNSGSVSKIKYCGIISSEPKVENRLTDNEPNSEKCCNSEPNFGICGFSGEIREDKVIGTPMSLKTPIYGSLCYEPPHLDDCVKLDSYFSSMQCLQHGYNSSSSKSPLNFFTPPSVRDSGSSILSPESILKMAAMSYHNTPSILRKRESFHALPPWKTRKVDGESVENTLHAYDEKDVTKNGLDTRSQDTSLTESPSCLDICVLDPSSKAFNASPPYRLRSNRSAIFKSVEKQLEFTFEKELGANPKSIDFSSKGHSRSEDYPPSSKMGVT